MKKVMLVMLVIVFTSVSVISCKNDKKEIKTEVATAVYQCPMNCEEGKSYTEAGKCPVCKMDLKEKEVKLDDNHQGDDH